MSPQIVVPNYIPLTPGGMAFIAEAPGTDEIARHVEAMADGKVGQPLVGSAGSMFTGACRAVGIDRTQHYVGNPFRFKLLDNDISHICYSAPEAHKDIAALKSGALVIPGVPDWAIELWCKIGAAPVATDKYVRSTYLPELVNLWSEIRAYNPSVLIPMGNTALWSVAGRTLITKCRGSRQASLLLNKSGKPFLMVPTFHPSHIQRRPNLRPLLTRDLTTAANAATLPAAMGVALEGYDKVVAHVPQTYEEVVAAMERWVLGKGLVAIDIETPYMKSAKLEVDEDTDEDLELDEEGEGSPPTGGTLPSPHWPPTSVRQGYQVDVIGFCARPPDAVVVCLRHPAITSGMWFTPDDTQKVITYLKTILESSQPKAFQNGKFDVAYLGETLQITVANWQHDTRIMNKAIDPAMPADLATLSATHLNFPPYKVLRAPEAKPEG